MSNLLFAIALTLVSGHDVAGEMPFAIPALRVSGSEILPSDSMIVLTRRSAARVALEVGPQSTIVFLDRVGPSLEAAGRPGTGHP